MKTSTVALLIVIVFVAVSGLATAAPPPLGPFSTTGYTLNLVSIPGYPFPIPDKFEILPSGYTKFQITAQGGPNLDLTNDAQCTALYGAPCNIVCLAATGQACGAAGFFQSPGLVNGDFTFTEWGLADPSFNGANHGDLKINTAGGQVDIRFGGVATFDSVSGSFDVTDATGDYKGIKEEGVYTGDAGYVFTVDYSPLAFTPCSDGNCPQNRCAIFGEQVKLHKDDLKWKIENEGEESVTISNILVNWPEGNGKIEKIKLGGKEIFKGEVGLSSAVPYVPGLYGVFPAPSWQGEERDRQIDKNKKEELKIEFGGEDVSENPWDYTILVSFSNGCAVPFVAFAPAP